MFDWIGNIFTTFSYDLLGFIVVAFVATLLANLVQLFRLKRKINTKKTHLNKKLAQAQKLRQALQLHRIRLEVLEKNDAIKHKAIAERLNRIAEIEKALHAAGSMSKGLLAPKLVRNLLELKITRDIEKRKTNTVVGMMLEEKLTKSKKNSSLIIVALLIYIGCSSFHLIQLNPFAIIVPLILLTAFYLDQYLIIYRVRKGWYGRNEYETREIISYIVAHADKDDFNDDGGLKKLMDAPENAKSSVQNEKGWVKA